MSTKQKTEKYLELVEKLMDYLVQNGKGVLDLPKNGSYIAFSSSNNELKDYAEHLLESIREENKKEKKVIIKAEEQQSPTSWKFTLITP